ncbi:MAG: hypothetical protein CYPHOPRED_002350 [Cyphobasidiales sp. Tagirdzhanova-0007]|nr:MAG: hypothetical protein CYPHOPRED_002350 [Cyphobasidiales sp. Tagirdzhanova-0007]
MGDTRERSPLLRSSSSLAQHHRLAPPKIRFPAQSLNPEFTRQNSYGFPTSFSVTDVKQRDEGLGERESGSDNGRSDSSSRLAMRREDSKTYTSFPVPANSPWENARSPFAEDASDRSFFSRLLAKKQYSPRQDLETQLEMHPGLPKVSRECIVAEVKCYGKYIVPTLLVFVGLVLLVALSIFYAVKK